ncbi:MAG: hypothetical protein HOV86_23425 [Thermoactinospora sp.]|nr:hypothetical protein [Thermoactinospora sp.]
MDKLRAWWAHRQGLDGRLTGAPPAQVLAETGWARSVGGSNPYFTLFARAGGSREQADRAAAALEICELPSARGCTYVLPAADFALGLTVGSGAAQGEAAKVMRLGVTEKELEDLAAGVLSVTGDAPLDPAALKPLLGDLVRNLGDAGRKAGVTTTLPVVLGLLQAAGEIRRVPVNGRFDQQRFGYVKWGLGGMPVENARVELARRYFRWTGAATPANLRWFTGWTVRDAKAAMAELELVDLGEGLLTLDADDYFAYERPAEPCYALVAGIDGIALLRRQIDTLVDGDETKDRLDLQSHAILDRGRLVGLWEYDPAEGELVWGTFEPPASADALREQVARTEAFAREQLGDVRSFSLDSPASRAPRLAAIRAMGR